MGHSVAKLVEALHFKSKVRELESNTNECQAGHLGIKATVCRADNITTFMSRSSRNSGSLNLLQQYGFIQACNGIANVITLPQKL